MQPLYSEGETIFVNSDLSGKADDDVVCESDDGRPGKALLRQLKEMGGQAIHPLNRRYKDLRVTKQPRVMGRVVQLRKNL